MGGFQKKYNGSWESGFNSNSKFSSTLNLNMPIQSNNQNSRRNSHYEQNRPRQNDYANQRINSSIAKPSRPCDFEKAFKSHMQNNYNKPSTSNQQQQLTNNRNNNNNNFRGSRNSVCVRNPPPAITVNQLDATYHVPRASEIPKPTTTSLSLVKVEPETTLTSESGNLSGRQRRNENDDTLVDENNNAAKKFRQTEMNSLNEAGRSHEPVRKCEKATQSDLVSLESPWNRERDLFLIRETMREYSRTFSDQFASQFIKRSLEVGRELRMNHADLANGMVHLLESAHLELSKSHHETTFSKEVTFTKPNTPITPQSESTRVGNVSSDQTILMRNMSKPANSSSPFASDLDLGNTKDISSKQGFTDFSDINSFTH